MQERLEAERAQREELVGELASLRAQLASGAGTRAAHPRLDKARRAGGGAVAASATSVRAAGEADASPKSDPKAPSKPLGAEDDDGGSSRWIFGVLVVLIMLAVAARGLR